MRKNNGVPHLPGADLSLFLYAERSTIQLHSAHSYYEHTIAYSYRCVFTVGKQASQRSQIVWCVWFIRRHLLWCMQYACTRAFVCVRHMTGECAEKIYFVIPFINLCLRSSVAATATRNKINDTERAASARRSQHFFLDKPANEKCEMRQHIWLFDCSCFTRDTHSHLMHIMIMWRAKQMIRMRYACVRCAGHKRRNDRSPNTTPKTLNL